jgi:hypothetical protein
MERKQIQRKGMFLIFASFILISGFVLGQSMTGNAVSIDAEYVTAYPGERVNVDVDVENNEDFDIEDITVRIVLEGLPFTSVGSAEKEIDDIDEDDDDSVSFTLKTSTDITPGDYNIPYEITYKNEDVDNETLEKTGSFGLRVSARTELDFTVEIRDNAIVGEEGRVSLEIINKGLGDLKSVSVQIFPDGFELLSKDKIFIGTVNADDTDLASFDVIYKKTNAVLSAKIEYKDFENKDQTETVNLPIKVYSRDEALEIGLIQKSKLWIYLVILVVIVAWIFFRRWRKKRKRNQEKKG